MQRVIWLAVLLAGGLAESALAQQCDVDPVATVPGEGGAFSADGRFFAVQTAYPDPMAVHVWSTEEGREVRTVSGFFDRFAPLQPQMFLTDGVLVDLDNWSERRFPNGYRLKNWGIPTGRRLKMASSLFGGEMILDNTTMQPVLNAPGRGRGVALSDNDRVAAVYQGYAAKYENLPTIDAQPDIALFDLPTGKPLPGIKYAPTVRYAQDILFSGGGAYLVTRSGRLETSGLESRATVWETSTGRAVIGEMHFCAAFSEDEALVATREVIGSLFGDVLVRRTRDGSLAARFPKQPGWEWECPVFRRGSSDEVVQMWRGSQESPAMLTVHSVARQAALGSLSLAVKNEQDVRYTEAGRGRFVAAISGVSRVSVADLDQRRTFCEVETGAQYLGKTAVSQDGRFLSILASFGAGGKLTTKVFAMSDPAETARQLMEAKRASSKLSAQQRGQAQGMFKQAFEMFQAGEFAAAIARFKQGLAIDPANGVAHFYLGEALARAGGADIARREYKRTIDFAPQSKEALIAQSKLGR